MVIISDWSDDGPIFSTIAKLVDVLQRAIPQSRDLELKNEALRLGSTWSAGPSTSRSDDRTAEGRAMALRLHRTMLNARVSSACHYDPALSRQPRATRSPGKCLATPTRASRAELKVIDRRRRSC